MSDSPAVLFFCDGVLRVPIRVDEHVFDRMAEFAPAMARRPENPFFLCNRVAMHRLDVYAMRAGSMQLYARGRADEELETAFNGVPVFIWEDSLA